MISRRVRRSTSEVVVATENPPSATHNSIAVCLRAKLVRTHRAPPKPIMVAIDTVI